MSCALDTQNRARAVIIHGTHLLVTRSNGLSQEFDSSMLFLPGGHIHHGETARSAVIRELTEELGSGWEHVSPTLLGVGDIHWEDSHGELYDEVNFVFRIRLPEGIDSQQIHSRDAYIDYLWVDLDTARRSLYPRSIAASLPTWLEHMQGEYCFAEETPGKAANHTAS